MPVEIGTQGPYRLWKSLFTANGIEHETKILFCALYHLRWIKIFIICKDLVSSILLLAQLSPVPISTGLLSPHSSSRPVYFSLRFLFSCLSSGTFSQNLRMGLGTEEHCKLLQRGRLYFEIFWTWKKPFGDKLKRKLIWVMPVNYSNFSLDGLRNYPPYFHNGAFAARFVWCSWRIKRPRCQGAVGRRRHAGQWRVDRYSQPTAHRKPHHNDTPPDTWPHRRRKHSDMTSSTRPPQPPPAVIAAA